MDFQAVARLPHYRPHREKNANFVIKVLCPSWQPWCVPTVSQKFLDRPGLSEFVLQGKHDVTDIWILVCHSLWVWGPLLWSQAQGNLWVKEDLQAFSSSECHSAHSITGKLSSFKEGKASTKSVFLELYSCQNCLTSNTWDLQACPEDLTSRVRALCLHGRVQALQNIPRPFCDCPWGLRLWKCAWQCWVPHCGHLLRWHSTANGPTVRTCQPAAASEIKKGGASLAISEVRKPQ